MILAIIEDFHEKKFALKRREETHRKRAGGPCSGSGAYLPEGVVEHVADANLRWRRFPIYRLPRH